MSVCLSVRPFVCLYVLLFTPMSVGNLDEPSRIRGKKSVGHILINCIKDTFLPAPACYPSILCGSDPYITIYPKISYLLCLLEGFQRPYPRISEGLHARWSTKICLSSNKVIFPPLNVILRVWKHLRSIPHEILHQIHLLAHFPVPFWKKLEAIPYPLTLLEIWQNPTPKPLTYKFSKMGE